MSQRGFSLVEVLVTLLIMKVGLLGILSAQTLLIKQVQDATQRTIAVALLNGFVTDIKINSAVRDVAGASFEPSALTKDKLVCPASSHCSADQLAQIQLQRLSVISDIANQHYFQTTICHAAFGNRVQLSIGWQSKATPISTNTFCSKESGTSGFTVQSYQAY